MFFSNSFEKRKLKETKMIKTEPVPKLSMIKELDGNI